MAKALVVDDSKFMRMTLKAVLTELGHQVIGEAEDGPTAVQQFSDLQPDFVTMDIVMPIESGIEAVKKIIGQNRNAKIIMVSAMGQENIIKDTMALGAKGFVIKPVNKSNLQESLRKIGIV